MQEWKLEEQSTIILTASRAQNVWTQSKMYLDLLLGYSV